MAAKGSVIGNKYEVLDEIGRGSTSVVYLVRDLTIRKEWALKQIALDDPHMGYADMQAVLGEIEIMKGLDHPVFPRIVDVFYSGASVCVVMDRIKGISMQRLLDECGPQDESRVTAWAKQLCEGLSYLHSKEPAVIHRDIKPANILIGVGDRVYIVDFGIAAAKAMQPYSLQAVGTKGYSPPEQYRGEADERSDIYSLGKTLEAALAGDGISAPMRKIIDRCTRQEPQRRYSGCEELLKDLRSLERTREHPEHKKGLRIAVLAASACAVLLAAVLSAGAWKNARYFELVSGSGPDEFYEAIKMFPGRTEAYMAAVEYMKLYGAENEELAELGDLVKSNVSAMSETGAELFYEIGRLYLTEYSGSLRLCALNARYFFGQAALYEGEFTGKDMAVCYEEICELLAVQEGVEERSYDEHMEVIASVEDLLLSAAEFAGDTAAYDRVIFCYVVCIFLNDQAESMAVAGVEKDEVLRLLDAARMEAANVSSSLEYVKELREVILQEYGAFVANIEAAYEEAEL